MVEVSFIIPSYNSHKTIERTIKSIFFQKAFDHIKELIVVDSSDDQKTRDFLRGLKDAMFKTVFLDQKTFPGSGRNIGAGCAAGNLLCFIDSDVYLDETWLDQILESYAAGCLAGAGSVTAADFQKKDLLTLAQLYLQFNESLEAGQRRPVSMVPACNMFVERALFKKAGGFPQMRASEDVVLCLRLALLSKVWFVPQARCFHIFRETFRAYFHNQKILGQYIIVYRRMMHGQWYYRGLYPLVLLPGFLLIKITRIIARVYKAGGWHCQNFFKSFPLFFAGLFFWAVGFSKGCFQKE